MLLLLACVAPDPPAADSESQRSTPTATDPCASGGWPEGDADVYVHEGADGDGSVDAPYGRLADAVTTEGVIAIGPGTYPAELVFQDRGSWELRGACPEQVRIVGDDSIPVSLQGGRNTRVTLSGLTVEGDGSTGLFVQGGTLTLDGVVVEGGSGTAIEATTSAAWVVVADSELRDTVARNDQAIGIAGWYGAEIEVDRTRFAGHASASVVVGGSGTRATVRDSTIEGGQYGVFAQDRGFVGLEGSVLRDMGQAGAEAWNEGEVEITGGRFERAGFFPLQAEDAGVVRATGTLVDGTAEGTGSGAMARDGGVVELYDSTIEHASPSLVAADDGGVLRVEGSVLRDPGGEGDLRMVVLQRGAWGQLSDVTMEGETRYNLVVMEAGAEVEGLRVTGPERDPGICTPAVVSQYGELTLRDAVLDRPWCVGVGAVGAGRLTLEGVAVDTPRPTGPVPSARGVELLDGVEVEADEVEVVGGTGAALLAVATGPVRFTGLVAEDIVRSPGEWTAVGVATQDAPVTLVDLEVRRTEGPGLYMHGTAPVTCDGCTFEDNRFAAIVTVGGDLSLQGGSVVRTTPDSSAGGGIGIYAVQSEDPVSVTLDGTTVGPHVHAAIWAESVATLDVRNADLSGGPGDGHGGWGAAVVARGLTSWDGTRGLRLADTVAHDAGVVAVLLDGGSGWFEGMTWSGNPVDVRQQRCEATVPPDGDLGRAELCPEYDLPLPPLFYTVQLVDTVPEL